MSGKEKVDSASGQLISHNPATNEYLGSIAFTPREHIDAKLKELLQAQAVLQQRTQPERKKLLKVLQFVIINSSDEVSLVINKSCGKSRQAALSEIFLAALALTQSESPSGNGQNDVDRRITVIISSSDYPLLLTLKALYSSILTGRTVMIVASPEATMVARLLERLIVECSELTPFVRVVYVDPQGDINHLSKEYVDVAATSAFRNERESEHGRLRSNSAMLVLDSADLKQAAKTALYAACRNAGQCPSATDRVYVVKSQYEQFVALVVQEAQTIAFGYSDQKKDLHEYGPLISQQHADSVAMLLDEAVKAGAVIRWGGERDRLFFQPAVLTEVISEMAVVRIATNSPLIPIIQVEDKDDAIEQVNRYPMRSCILFGEGVSELQNLIDAEHVNINSDSAEFTITAKAFGKVLRPPVTIIEQLNRPGNYRLLKTLLMAQYGATPAQRLTAIDLFRNSYKVQQMLNQVSEKTAKVLGRA